MDQVMQRVGNLFTAFSSFENLYSAWKKTAKGCGRTPERAQFFQDLETELIALQTEFRNDSWRPQPFRYFDIYDPKHRQIAVAPFRDRVVHHALVNVLELIFEKVFIADSYATRKGKGVHAAVFKAQHFTAKYTFYLKTDVEKFFDSVCHNTLLQIIERKIKDRKILGVCERLIRHGGTAGKGLPIGNRTSQFFANVYLNPLDHFIKAQCRVNGYVRYMDDFVLFENDKKRLLELRRTIEDFLQEKLHLQLKEKATFLNRQQNGLPFLGRRIFPSLIRLRTENLRRIQKRLAFREKQFELGDIEETEFLHSMNSYWAMLSFYPELKPLRDNMIYSDARSFV
ncbi:MAG: reverse transcriptase/maturase family protein [Bacteroidota bacterium]